MRALLVFLLTLSLSLPVAPTRADDNFTLRIVRGHSRILNTSGPVATIAVGNPGIVRATAVKNTAILINAGNPGSTSLTLILKNGAIVPYRIIVTHDVTHLARHLQQLDPRIRVESDPNADAIILTGIVRNKSVVERAFEAATRYFGQSEITISTNPRENRERPAQRSPNAPPGSASASISGSEGAAASAEPVSGAEGERSRISEELTSGATRVINLLVTEDALRTAAERLQDILRRVDSKITVEEVNGVFILRGKVATPTSLSRALALADRFVRAEGNPEFAVISDRGGVLAGNLTAEDEFEPVVDPLSLPGLGGVGSSSAVTSTRTGGSRRGGGSLPAEVSPAKGNLGQNVSRADVVMIAGGRVMSLLEVAHQPRVEIKMSIVAVDRNRTEELGINWRIDGSRVSVSTAGNRLFTPPNDPISSLPPVPLGGLNAVAKLVGGTTTVQAFLQALEQTGAAQSVSEPILSAVSGEATSFLVGGNIPLPVETVVPGTPTQNALVLSNVEFIEFGLRIVARPTVLEDGRISIVLDQMFTEPDNSRAITIDGVVIPGFKQRSVRTLTESSDGETWAVAGLVSDTDTQSTSAVPWISRLPVLGVLFRSKSDEKVRTELIVTVTARKVPEGGFAAMAPTASVASQPPVAMRDAPAPAPRVTTATALAPVPVPAQSSIPAQAAPAAPPESASPATGAQGGLDDRAPNWDQLNYEGRR